MISTIERLFSESPPALFMVFWIGAAASLTSCTVVRLPVVMGYVAGSGNSKGRALVLTALFTLGLVMAYVLLGTATAFTGSVIHRFIQVNKYVHWVLGVFLFASGLLVSGLVGVRLLPKGCQRIAEGLCSASFVGAFLFGGFFGLLVMPACPCCGAGLLVLAGVVVAKHMSWSYSLAVFASFALGQSLPVLAVGVLTSLVKPDLVRKLRQHMCSIEQRMQLLAGNILMVLGIYFVIVG
ncbi:MAG: sulfite exporter TauE/SafE family protein [Sedimentisphaerales bacterium]|nr:sulfite exporter TauE/SafE family protein [Sedimentisphaerales bacterium]